MGCSSLTNVTLPNSVTSIAGYAFSDCYGLTSVTIPSSVSVLGVYAFFDCYELAGVFFLGNAPSYDASVFENSNPTVYYLPGTSGWTRIFAVPLQRPDGAALSGHSNRQSRFWGSVQWIRLHLIGNYG